MKINLSNTMDAEKIKILLVDDSPIILDGLAFNLLLQDDFSITGKALSAQEALNSISLGMPDILLLDISLQEESDGIELLKEIRSEYPGIKVLIFSQQKNVRSIVDSIRNGANAYLSKDSSVEEIVDAIGIVAKGKGIFLGETIPAERALPVITILFCCARL